MTVLCFVILGALAMACLLCIVFGIAKANDKDRLNALYLPPKLAQQMSEREDAHVYRL